MCIQLKLFTEKELNQLIVKPKADNTPQNDKNSMSWPSDFPGKHDKQ